MGDDTLIRVWVPTVSTLPPKANRHGATLIVDEPPDPVWNGMSRLDFFRIAAYIRWTADVMGLRDWKIQLNWTHAGDGEDGHHNCYARIEVLNAIRVASIWLGEDFAYLPADEKRRTICHELVHVHLDALTEIGNETILAMCGYNIHRMMADETHRAIEAVTESIAMNWALRLEPIPDTLTADDDVLIQLDDGSYLGIEHYIDLQEKE